MELNIALQTLIFLKSAVLGMATGLLYDVLRALRWETKAGRGLTAILDALFWVFLCVMLFLFVVIVARGDGRGYILIGMGLGLLLYFITFSEFLLMSLRRGLRTVRGIIQIPKKIWLKSTPIRSKICNFGERCKKKIPIKYSSNICTEKLKKKLSIFRKKV